MSEYIDTLNINDVDYDIKDSGALHQSDVAAVATSGSYSDLTNKPKINNVELTGNKTAAQLGLQTELTIDATPTANSTNPVQSGGVEEALGSLYRALSVAENCLFGGYVEPNDEPRYGDDHRYYYLAKTEGRYTHFNNYEVDNYIVMFLWYESTQSWRMLTLWPNDQTVSEWLQSKQDTISDLATIRSGAALGATSVQSSEKGAASGVATLDSGGKVPQSQLPSYVDDVLEYANLASFPATGESGKIYVALDTNKTYRWSGSAYVEIAQGLALGETSSTAFPGDRGKAIEDKIPSSASSSNKLATASDVSAKYTKPSTGIPKTDLASAVQTSLGKADTALQSYTETDPVFTASAAHGISSTDISNWNAKGTYSKPSGGIPKTDLASAVQTSLGKADTALQSYTETDPIFQASPAAGITSGDISDWDGKADKVVYVDASTPPSTMDSNKVYQYGTLSGNTTFPAFTAVSSGDTEVKIWCWTFTTPSTAPTITWPAGITAWNGGSAPTINASKNYEVSVMDGVACIIES